MRTRRTLPLQSLPRQIFRQQSQITRGYQPRISRMSSSIPSPESANANLREEYAAWRAMGIGGTSPTWVGFLSNKAAEKTIAFSDTLTADLYARPEKYATGWKKATEGQRVAAQKPFLKEPLPQRAGPRARAKHFVYPQRERNASDYQDPVVKETYQAMFHKLGEANPDTEWKISALEKHGTALFLRQDVALTPIAGPTQREICHIHGTDLSGHVTLSFPDAMEVIEKGWGERHRLSGTDWVHLGYTMLYVPNSVEEVDVLVKIYQAGVEFMRTG